MAPFGIFVVRIHTLFFGIIRFAGHLGFAMRPHNSHSCFRVTDVTNLLRKIWIRLKNKERLKNRQDEGRELYENGFGQKIKNKSVSMLCL